MFLSKTCFSTVYGRRNQKIVSKSYKMWFVHTRRYENSTTIQASRCTSVIINKRAVVNRNSHEFLLFNLILIRKSKRRVEIVENVRAHGRGARLTNDNMMYDYYVYAHPALVDRRGDRETTAAVRFDNVCLATREKRSETERVPNLVSDSSTLSRAQISRRGS